MLQFNTDHVKDALFSTINSLFEQREVFLNNPSSDFTRIRKISFQQTILFPMIAGSDNIDSELLDFFGEKGIPYASSMIQRRNQVKPSAYRELFHQFLQSLPAARTFHGYRIAACDGSRINLPYHPSDKDTFIQCINGRKGINQLHMNSLYDPLNDLFLDVELQGIHQMNEKRAFCSFLDKYRNSKTKTIFIADRGYASYNIFAHAIHNNQLFLIRVPESFAKSMDTSDDGWMKKECEDNLISLHIGRCRKAALQKLKNYHCITKRSHYDFIKPESEEFECLQLRVLKFPLSEGSYEYIVTNLPKYAFTLEIIKELYHLRWEVETAFRYLKYAGNMVRIHSLKKDFLYQEIYGKLTMYNFSSFLCAAVGKVQKTTDKYVYVLNHTQAQKSCIRFLKGTIKNIEEMICRYVVPVRPNRNFTRKLRRQSADTLTYR